MRSIQTVDWASRQCDEVRVLGFSWAKHAADIANTHIGNTITGKNGERQRRWAAPQLSFGR